MTSTPTPPRGGEPERIGEILPRVLRQIADSLASETQATALVAEVERLEAERAQVRNHLACARTAAVVEECCVRYLNLSARLRTLDSELRRLRDYVA
jgi:hypothetical protein